MARPADNKDVHRIVVKPNSKPQEQFFAASEYEVLFGGAAGGGKSWSIVVDPLRYISYGDFTAIIFRRTYPELEGSILPLAKYYYQAAGASYNDQKKTFTFPSGATIRLGFMQHEDDWTNYQGHEYAGQYFDELTNFTEAQYTQISPWNRSRAAGIPPYRRSSSNPGGVGHSWVKQRFVDLCPPVPDGEQRYSELGRMWWQPMKPGKTYCWKTENGMKLTRKFIPSRVFDNEDLLRKNPVYLAQLLSLPVERRKALLEGDWDVFEGQFFQFSKAVHVIEPFIPPADWPRVGGLDYGQRTVLEIQARDPEGRIVNFGEVYTEHQTPTERANQIAEYLLEREIYRLPIQYDTNMDLDLRHYSGYDKTQSAIFREVFAQRMGDKAPVMTVVSKSTTDRRGYRQVTNEAMKEYLRYEMGDDGKVLHRPMFLITSDCRRLIQTLPTLIHDPDSPDGLDFDQKVGVDDPYDAAKMALMWLRTPIAASAPKPAPPKTFADMMQPAYLDGIFNRKMKQAKRLRRVG